MRCSVGWPFNIALLSLAYDMQAGADSQFKVLIGTAELELTSSSFSPFQRVFFKGSFY